MPLPNQPVTLTAEQVAELHSKLRSMCHRINNKLAVIVAGIEVIRMKPESLERAMQSLDGQSREIQDAHEKFSAEFQQMLGITRY